MHTSEPGTQLPKNSVRYNVAVTSKAGNPGVGGRPRRDLPQGAKVGT